jgi:hypothetical protein
MKKVVFGCLGVLVILLVAGGVASYFAYRSAKSYISSFSQLQEIPKINEQVRNTAAFTPPANGELTDDAVARFMAVQTSLRDRLGARVTELDEKYKALDRQNGGEPSITDGLSALKDLGGLILEAKKVQVDALNEQRFSLAEYDWTRKSMYVAAGVPLGMNFDEVIRQAQGGTTPTAESTVDSGATVPEKNKELVAPHAEALRENAGFAFFGL